MPGQAACSLGVPDDGEKRPRSGAGPEEIIRSKCEGEATLVGSDRPRLMEAVADIPPRSTRLVTKTQCLRQWPQGVYPWGQATSPTG